MKKISIKAALSLSVFCTVSLIAVSIADLKNEVKTVKNTNQKLISFINNQISLKQKCNYISKKYNIKGPITIALNKNLQPQCRIGELIGSPNNLVIKLLERSY